MSGEATQNGADVGGPDLPRPRPPRVGSATPSAGAEGDGDGAASPAWRSAETYVGPALAPAMLVALRGLGVELTADVVLAVIRAAMVLGVAQIASRTVLKAVLCRGRQRATGNRQQGWGGDTGKDGVG